MQNLHTGFATFMLVVASVTYEYFLVKVKGRSFYMNFEV